MHARHQDAGVADDQPARLEDQLAVEPAGGALHHRGIGGGIGRRIVVLAIGNAEAAAEVDMRDGVAVAAQRAHEIGQQREGIVERLHLDDLAADVHVDAGNAQALQLGGARIDLAGAADRDAELVLRLAGRDLGVGLGIDVGIDAHRDVRGLALRHRDFGEQFELGLGLDVDAEDVLVERQRELARGLADAREHDLAAPARRP